MVYGTAGMAFAGKDRYFHSFPSIITLSGLWGRFV